MYRKKISKGTWLVRYRKRIFVLAAIAIGCIGLYMLVTVRSTSLVVDKHQSTHKRPAASYSYTAEQGSTGTQPASAGDASNMSEKLPSQIIDLHNWYLTLPMGDDKSAGTINQPALHSYTSPYFQADATNKAVVFTAPVKGATTDHSDHTRSELREVAPDGSLPWGWSTGSGMHSMMATEAILHLPSSRGAVGFAQIHGAGSKWYIILIATGNGNGTITLSVKDSSGKANGAIIDPAYVLGTKFALNVTANNGAVTISYNDTVKIRTTSDSTGNYFKIGCYDQSSGDFGQVAVYSLSVSHS